MAPAAPVADRVREVEASAAPAVLLPAPLRPFLEGFAGLALLLILDVVLTQGVGLDGFSGWAVHPFWLPVLWVAARHGALAGVAVALAASLTRLGLALAAGALTANAWAEPVTWPLAAALVGLLVDRGRARLGAAEARAAAAEDARQALAESNERLAVRAIELDARLAARLAATTAIFDAARALGNGTEGVLRGAAHLVRAATGCAACSFWLAEGGGLKLVSAEGWPEGARLARSFQGGALVDALVASRGALLVARPADRMALAGQGIMAAPVRSPGDASLLGMVKVEEIGFADLAPDTIAALEAAAAWLGAALAAARGQEAQTAGGDGMIAGDEAARSIATMLRLARRLRFDLALLSAEIPTGPRAAAALEATRAAMAESFRGSDLLLEARQHDHRLSVLLPGADLQGAEVAAARLKSLLAARAPAATADVVVGLVRLHAAQG